MKKAFTLLLLLFLLLPSTYSVLPFTSVSVALVVDQGIRAGFADHSVKQFGPVSDRYDENEKVMFAYNGDNATFEVSGLYYYIQVFIPQKISYSITCSSLYKVVDGTRADSATVSAADMTLTVGTDGTTTYPADETGVIEFSYVEDGQNSDFIHGYDFSDPDNPVEILGDRKYPSLYSSDVKVSFPSSLIKESGDYAATLTLNVKVIE